MFAAFRVEKNLEVDTFMFSFNFVSEKEFRGKWRRNEEKMKKRAKKNQSHPLSRSQQMRDRGITPNLAQSDVKSSASAASYAIVGPSPTKLLL